MTDTKTDVLASTLGQPGETVQTPRVVRFTGARLVVWTEPAADPSAIEITFELSANLMLVQRFELDLLLADKAAWAVLAETPVQGPIYPHEDHTVTLLRFGWDGNVTVVAKFNGHEFVERSHDGVPQEVWTEFRSAHVFYCTNDSRR